MRPTVYNYLVFSSVQIPLLYNIVTRKNIDNKQTLQAIYSTVTEDACCRYIEKETKFYQATETGTSTKY